METVAQIGAKVTEVKESAEALARSAGKKLDRVSSGTADVLHTAASSIRSSGRQSAEVIRDCATGTADKLDAAGNYVEKHRATNLGADLRRAVRKYPAGSLILATAFGFLAATVFRAITHSSEPAEKPEAE
jgi:hypothetical protein